MGISPRLAEKQKELDRNTPVGEVAESAQGVCDGHDHQHQPDDVEQHLIAPDVGEVVGGKAHDRGHNILLAADVADRACVQDEHVAMVAEDQGLSPTMVSEVLGISRSLVVHRMEIGDLPFRTVGTHRIVRLKDVLELKHQLDIRQKALDALAEVTEDLIANHVD